MSEKCPFREIQITLSGRQRKLVLLAVETFDEQFEDTEFEKAGFSAGEARQWLVDIRNQLLPGLWIELTRAVEDEGGDFDAAREYEFSKNEIYAAIAQELEWAREAKYLRARKKDIPKLARKFRWEDEPRFLEFDSGRSHACGYWELRIQGPDALEYALANYQEAA